MRRNTSINNSRGFSLIELCIALGILVILTSSITPIFIKRIQVKAGEKTALEMSVIQQAALSYYITNNAWPASIQALQNAGYLNPSWPANNPWQNVYAISSNNSAFTVSTTVPREWTNLVARDLPTSSISGDTVGSTVPAPGSAPDESLPAGAIIMWSGALSSIPANWQLCDGTNGTPDLRGRFIMGVSTGENPGATGGSSTHTHPLGSHTHPISITSTQGSQSHWNGWQNGDGGWFWGQGNDHTHNVIGTTGQTGGDTGSTSSLPPYYKLAYIMKML